MMHYGSVISFWASLFLLKAETRITTWIRKANIFLTLFLLVPKTSERDFALCLIKCDSLQGWLEMLMLLYKPTFSEISKIRIRHLRIRNIYRIVLSRWKIFLNFTYKNLFLFVARECVKSWWSVKLTSDQNIKINTLRIW